jgi:hypothetical protein
MESAMKGMLDGVGSFVTFTFWFIPIASALALWKIIEIIIWAVGKL